MAVDINTGISDLATAITGLTSQFTTLDQTLNTRISLLVTAIDNIPPGCGCPTMGTETPTGNVVEVDPPPEGYGEWDPVIDDRKCKLANMIFDDIYFLTEVLIANDVENIASLGAGAMGALLGMVLVVVVSGPVAWGLAGLGAIAGVIAFFLLQSVALDTLLGLLAANQQALVCALYTAGSSQDGLDDFQTILLGAGANAAMIAYLDALKMLNSLAVMFFQPEGAMGEEIEQRLDGYPMTIDCAVCVPIIGPMDWLITPGPLWTWDTASGHLGSGAVLNDGSAFLITSEVATAGNPGWAVISLVVSAYLLAGPCPAESGELRIQSSPGGYASNGGLQCVDFTWCGVNPFSTGMPTTGVSVGMMVMLRAWNDPAPRQMTFSVDSPPTVCP